MSDTATRPGRPRRRGPNTRLRPRPEALEDRRLLTGPVIDPISPVTVPAGKSLILPVTATDTDGNPLTYTVASNNPKVTATVHTGNPFLKLSVAGFGDMTFELLRDVAPHTVDTIAALVNRGFYNGLTFHRVVPNFVIQGGDPLGNGMGGPGFQFDDEFNAQAIFSGDGQLAMANSGADTNGSQFFVTLGAHRVLDFRYDLFGQLVRGFDVLRAIDAVPNSGPPDNRPNTPVVITSATIVPDTTDAVVTLTAAPGAGPATINVTADDGHGGQDSKPMPVQVVADTMNDPPFLGPVSDQTTATGTPVTFNLTSVDLENDPPDYAAIVLDSPAHATVAVNGNAVTVTPDPGFTGVVHLGVGVRETGPSGPGSFTSFDTQRLTLTVVNQSISAQGVALHATKGVALSGVTVATFTAAVPGNAQDYGATISWGDGTSSAGTVVANAGGGYRVLGSHTYGAGGSFTVGVRIHEAQPAADGSATGTATVAAPKRTAGDYDGDGKADIAVYRPTSGLTIILRSGGGGAIVPLGAPNGGDVPLRGDFDGDGKADVAVYRPSTGQWIILRSSAGPEVIKFGAPNTDIPVPGDYDGDGKTDIAVYRPSTGQWIILESTAGLKVVTLGAPNLDRPVPGDYDGDGKTDPAVYRPTTGQWIILQSKAGPRVVTFGAPRVDVPIPADYDGDGKTDIAVYRPTTNQWLILQSSGGTRAATFGDSRIDIPVPADYDGDGKADIAVYRKTTGQWLILQSTAGPRIVPLGQPNVDVPVQAPLAYRYRGGLQTPPNIP
jgi:cyclophilin family peptidyl-prolyl cis-trans isomerase